MASIYFGTNLLESFGLATRIYTLGRHPAIFHPARPLIYFGTNETARCALGKLCESTPAMRL